MKCRRWLGCALMATSFATAGCSSSTAVQNTTTTTSSQTSTSSSAPTSNTPGSSAPAANVQVTDAVKAELLAAGAELNSIPVTEFTGLAPGLTYYALDKVTNIHWAGARLQPAPTPSSSPPSRAQVSSQDQGSYYIFQKPQGGPWSAYAAGNTGPSTPCPVAIPAAVLAVWGWTPASCRPSGV